MPRPEQGHGNDYAIGFAGFRILKRGKDGCRHWKVRQRLWWCGWRLAQALFAPGGWSGSGVAMPRLAASLSEPG